MLGSPPIDPSAQGTSAMLLVSAETDPLSSTAVVLADGTTQLLDELSDDQLHRLQWDQEQEFARQMIRAPKGSALRSEMVARAYDTVCTIYAAQQNDDQPVVMGLDRRYPQLIQELLGQQTRQGLAQPCFFEIGYGSGGMLKDIADLGYTVAGLEVSVAMREQALGVLGDDFADQLLLGNLLDVRDDELAERPSLIYWNDVFEHICPDEISEYLDRIHDLLPTGGQLVTITPNWLLRPSDVTGDFCRPRTEANGLHLKEYSLQEVTDLLKQSGFRQVATPLLVSKGRMYRWGGGLRSVKQWIEPVLDHLPVRLAHLICRGAGMSCTIATK